MENPEEKPESFLQPSNNADVILNSLPDSIVAINAQNHITYVNVAAEQLFGSGARILLRKSLKDIVAFDSPLMSLVGQARKNQTIISKYDINIGNPYIGDINIDIHVSPLQKDRQTDEHEQDLLIQLQQRGIAQKINQQKTHKSAVRTVSGMAAILAHEIKNPLSGIKGSAQLLAQEVSDEDKQLTSLICEEVDRICTLVDRMEIFTNFSQIAREDINIHSVLEHVRKLAENGFGKNVQFQELYDPSLPKTLGDRGQLIQMFLNLIKNACEAVDAENGKIIISTAYRHGIKIAVSDSDKLLHLPLEISITNNGEGISDDVISHIFDPFVTTKSGGTGLGLALVAKIVSDHGGIIECDSNTNRTIFKILLPAAPCGDKKKK